MFIFEQTVKFALRKTDSIMDSLQEFVSAVAALLYGTTALLGGDTPQGSRSTINEQDLQHDP